MLRVLLVDDEDTVVGPMPWADTDRDVLAQGASTTTPQMLEDTGVVIINRPAEPTQSDSLVVTFRAPRAGITFRPKLRASTLDSWPPPPREPAIRAPKNAAILTAVSRPETQS